MDLKSLKWGPDGLLPVVVQANTGGSVRMVAYANAEALARTLDTGLAHFYSRSREALWLKGETSGNTIGVHEVWVDCDRDTVLYLGEPKGPSCHTGAETCFFRRLDAPAGDSEVAAPVLTKLWRTLESRRDESTEDKSYTRSLLNAGPAKIADKVREEANELAHALTEESTARVNAEAADLMYHLMVGLLVRGLDWNEVEAELARRFGMSGHDEKASRG